VAKTRRTPDAVKIIDRMVGDDAELRAMIDEERAGAEVAQLIHDARTRAGLTQRELAELIGTSQPTIARLEDADYEGHSLGMLRRIAAALHLRLELRLVPDHEAAKQPYAAPRNSSYRRSSISRSGFSSALRGSTGSSMRCIPLSPCSSIGPSSSSSTSALTSTT